MGAVEHPGLRVKYEIYKQGMTLMEFSRHSGIHMSTINDFVRCRYNNPNKTLVKLISRQLEVDVDDLYLPVTKRQLKTIERLKKKTFQNTMKNIRFTNETKEFKRATLRKFAELKGLSYVEIKGEKLGFKFRYDYGSKPLISGLMNREWYDLYKMGKLEAILDELIAKYK